MSEIKIPPKIWKSFLETFSQRHSGSLVRIQTHDTKTGENVLSQLSALRSIEFDDEDQRNLRINVTVLYDSKTLKHILFKPSHVTLYISDQNDEDSLTISSVNTDTTIRMRGTKKVDVLDVLKTMNVLDVVRDEAA